MNTLEEKIYYKVKNSFEAYKFRDKSGGSTRELTSNEKQYLIDVTNAMVKILKAEVNIRLQEEKHHPKGQKI